LGKNGLIDYFNFFVIFINDVLGFEVDGVLERGILKIEKVRDGVADLLQHLVDLAVGTCDEIAVLNLI